MNTVKITIETNSADSPFLIELLERLGATSIQVIKPNHSNLAKEK